MTDIEAIRARHADAVKYLDTTIDEAAYVFFVEDVATLINALEASWRENSEILGEGNDNNNAH